MVKICLTPILIMHLYLGEAFMGYSELLISQYVVSAICGCWWQESNCNPEVWESLIPCAWDYQYEYTNKGGYGLGQWTNVGTQHGRLWNLHEWVTSNGYQDGDGYGQLEYVLVENHWNTNNPSRLGYTTLEDYLQSTSTNLDNLVYDFLSRWEGVPGNQYTKRCRNARKILEYITAHSGDGEIYTWITGNNYLSESQILNNAMVIYQYMSNNIGPLPPVPPIDRTHKMPLWMMIRKKRYIFKQY